MESKAFVCTFALFCVAIVVGTSLVCLSDDGMQISYQNKDYECDNEEVENIVPIEPHDEKFCVGDLYYKINSDKETACLVSHNPVDKVCVPDTVEYKGKSYYVTKIGYEALGRFGTPYEIEIGCHIKEIDDSAFRTYKGEPANLCKFTINKIECSELTTIGMDAFRGLKNLKSIELPESLTLIKNSAFRDSGLETCILHSKSLEIRESAFRCTPLMSINLEKVKVLGNGAFHECHNLKVADLTSIQSLAKTTFKNCPLENVVIGNDLQKIRSDSFHMTKFFDGNGNELTITVENLRGNTFEMKDGKLCIV